MKAFYTDGSEVKEGDRVRYHQTPGGLLSPETNLDGSIKWHEGIAEKYPRSDEERARLLERGIMDPDELHCHKFERSVWGEWGHMAPHIIEPLDGYPPDRYQFDPAKRRRFFTLTINK